MMRYGASLHTSNHAINRAFDWALRQASQYVREDAPIGPCYEAALPGRESFCMRDTAHQVLGAQVLGRKDCNRNMLGRFARALHADRSFCSFWEIDFDGRPTTVDYTSDTDFWYNLPANFDITDACRRLYHWTGEPGYLLDAEMDAFHRATTEDYVRQWDRDHDGVPDRRLSDGRRGIASYDESRRNPDYRVAADLITAQCAAYFARCEALALKGEQDAAGRVFKKALALHKTFENEWWLEGEGRFAPVLFQDGRYGGDYVGMDAFMPLYFGVVRDARKLERQLRYIIENDGRHNQEERSYLPEILWRYGANEAAEEVFLRMTGPGYQRREYPEVSFAALGAIAEGYMGVRPNATKHELETRSAVQGSAFAELNHLPLWGGHIHLLHEGQEASTLENLTCSDLLWRCRFEGGAAADLLVPAGETRRLRRQDCQ